MIEGKQFLLLLVFGVMVPAAGYLGLSGLARADRRITHFSPDSANKLAEARRQAALQPKQEIEVVVIAGVQCSPSTSSSFVEAVKKVQNLVREQVQDSLQIRFVGIAVGSDPGEGIELLNKIGRFDEVMAGGNWLNIGTEKFIWGPSGFGLPETPQIILLERTVHRRERSIAVIGEHVLQRFVGDRAIEGWVNGGAAITSETRF